MPSAHSRPAAGRIAFTLLLAVCACRQAQTTAPEARSPAPGDARPVALARAQDARDVEEDRWTPVQTDFPFQASALGTRSAVSKTVDKSIAIRLGAGLAVSFDTDLLRVAAGWAGELITPTGVTFDTVHGVHPQAGGEPHFTTAPVAGWADARGRFDDPRPLPHGPLPTTRGRWDGLYTHGMDVVLAYTVGGTSIHEQPSAVRAGDRVGFARTIEVGDLSRPLALLIADVPGARTRARATASAPGGPLAIAVPGARDPNVAAGASANAAPKAPPAPVHETTEVAVVGAPAGSRLEADGRGRISLRLPRSSGGGALFKVIVTRSPTGSASALQRLTETAGPPRLVDFRGGGPRHWPRPIITRGVRAPDSAPYVVDRLTTPYPGVYKGPPPNGDWKDNIYRRRIMIAGLDFFPDGRRAALSTWEGDVWIVDGIEGDLARLGWHRFASGLYEPLGLAIVDGAILVAGRDQITRLHDLNGDGEADHYQNFNNQVTNSPGFHEFQFDLQQDRKGYLYTAKAAPVRAGGRGFGGGGGNGELTPFAGTIQRIPPDGKRREVYATGLRAPNGIGVSADGQVTTADNEGTWVPASPIHWVRPGAFLGVPDTAHRRPVPTFDPPLCWISKTWDNSSGGQVWVTTDARWGPFAGELLHLSYGRAAIYLVMKQRIGGRLQGGIVPLVGGAQSAPVTGKPARLTSSAMRARFNPADGQLYVAGLSGWQSDAVALTGFDRVRYTGKTVHGVRALAATRAGVELTFTQPLDPASVDPQNFSGERWNYVRSSAYGSPETSVADPGRRGHDRLELRGARLSPDGRSVLLDIEDLRPAQQMLINLRVVAADGTPIRQSVMHTIHELPPDARAVARPGDAKIARTADRGPPGLLLRLAPAGTTASARAADHQIVTSPRLHVRAGEPPSPFLPAGPFTATWEGTLWPDLRGDHVLMAQVSGELRVTINEQLALASGGAGAAEVQSRPLALERRPNKLAIVLHGAAGADTTLRLYWARRDREAPAAPFEPIPEAAFRQPRAAGVAEVKRLDALRAGRGLFLEHRCASCHLPEAQRGSTPELAARAPDFAGLGSRLDWRWVREWVLDPRAQRSDATMPALLRGREAPAEADAIAGYLATLRDPARDARREQVARQLPLPAGGNPAWRESPGVAIMDRLRCAGCHIEQENDPDDGRAPLSHARRKLQLGSLALFLEQPAEHYPWNPMPHVGLGRADAVQIELSLRGRVGPPTPTPPPADPAVIARGRDLVETRGCLRCHDAPGAGLKDRGPTTVMGTLKGSPNPPATVRAGQSPAAPHAIQRLTGGNAGNCLQGTGPARYALEKPEVAQLDAFIDDFAAAGMAPVLRHVPRDFAERQLRQLRCLGCHDNDRHQDVPRLDLVGEKLRPEWVAAFIGGKVPYKPRAERHPDGQPWLPARMPTFAGQAALLAEGLAAAAGHPARTPPDTALDPALARTGATLVSAAGGLSCVACHGVGNKPPTQVFEVEGINFSHAADRLRPDFFRRWLRDPPRIDPSTRMPRYFDDTGQSPLTDILDGSADAQIEAMWHYLRSLAAR